MAKLPSDNTNSKLGLSIHSIPHNTTFRQANFGNWAKISNKKSTESALRILGGVVESPTQEAARTLYDAGLNVFPQPLGRKGGYRWKMMQYTRLHRTDEQYGLHAAFVGNCNIAVMCGRTSDNLFVIDCETEEAFAFNIAAMRYRRIPIWAAKTARGGHIYLRCAEGEVENIETGTIPNIEVRGHNRYVLAPPSLHPDGTIYQWHIREGDRPPLVSAEMVNWLRDKHGEQIMLEVIPPPVDITTLPLTIKSPMAALCYETQDYIVRGHTVPEGERNNRLFKAACDMAGCGYTKYEAWEKLAEPAMRSGLPEAEVRRTINSAYSQPRGPSRPFLKNDAIRTNNKDQEIWAQILIFVKTHRWNGRTASSDQATMLALVQRARAYINENGVFRASVRELAELAHLSPTTIQKALKRLQDYGFIQRAGSDKLSSAGLWRFTDKILHQLKSVTLEKPPQWKLNSVTVFNSEVCERGGLTLVMLDLYFAMVSCSQWGMPSFWCDYTKLSISQVNYGLRKLQALGLVEHSKKGWRACMATNEQIIQRVYATTNIAGKSERRRQRHRIERAIFAGKTIINARHRAEQDDFFDAWWEFQRQCRYQRGDYVPKLPAHSPLEEFTASMVQSQRNQTLQHDITAATETANTMKLWECPNCGQRHFSDEEPPDICDYCQDMTTWRVVAQLSEEDAPNLPPQALKDELIRMAIETLGAVLVEHDEEEPPPPEESGD
ncbi:MAG: winged helix-turn-helix transcriptional regulator [Chloroflexi bacterium]|nr:MAG: winged helix-turn-helix transcriptional regulator [Chloroflexota bacterium]